MDEVREGYLSQRYYLLAMHPLRLPLTLQESLRLVCSLLCEWLVARLSIFAWLQSIALSRGLRVFVKNPQSKNNPDIGIMEKKMETTIL